LHTATGGKGYRTTTRKGDAAIPCMMRANGCTGLPTDAPCEWMPLA
jgi:hypothetical protein